MKRLELGIDFVNQKFGATLFLSSKQKAGSSLLVPLTEGLLCSQSGRVLSLLDSSAQRIRELKQALQVVKEESN